MGHGQVATPPENKKFYTFHRSNKSFKIFSPGGENGQIETFLQLRSCWVSKVRFSDMLIPFLASKFTFWPPWGVARVPHPLKIKHSILFTHRSYQVSKVRLLDMLIPFLESKFTFQPLTCPEGGVARVPHPLTIKHSILLTHRSYQVSKVRLGY